MWYWQAAAAQGAQAGAAGAGPNPAFTAAGGQAPPPAAGLPDGVQAVAVNMAWPLVAGLDTNQLLASLLGQGGAADGGQTVIINGVAQDPSAPGAGTGAGTAAAAGMPEWISTVLGQTQGQGGQGQGGQGQGPPQGIPQAPPQGSTHGAARGVPQGVPPGGPPGGPQAAAGQGADRNPQQGLAEIQIMIAGMMGGGGGGGNRAGEAGAAPRDGAAPGGGGLEALLSGLLGGLGGQAPRAQAPGAQAQAPGAGGAGAAPAGGAQAPRWEALREQLIRLMAVGIAPSVHWCANSSAMSSRSLSNVIVICESHGFVGGIVCCLF